MKYLILLILLIPFLTFAQEPQQLWKDGNVYFSEERYSAAAEAYEEILAQGYYAPEVYFNLGLAYYHLNKIGPAIYNLEKAKKIDPGNEDVQYALRTARLGTANTEAGFEEGVLQQWWHSVVMSFSSTTWGIISIIFIWIAFSIAFLFFFTKDPVIKRASFFSIFIALIIGLFSLFFTFEYQKRLTESKEAIVYEGTASVKAEPEASSGELFMLYEGAKMKVLEQKGDWIKIDFNDSRSGWIRTINIRYI